MADEKEAKAQALKIAIDQIEKQHGKGAVMRLGEGPIQQVEVTSTGSISLDAALGIGGIPRGRVIEIFGPESSGKTTLCLHIIAEAQHAGGSAHSWTPSTLWTLATQRNWDWTRTISSCRSLSSASRHWKSSRLSSAAGHLTSSSLTPWQR